MAGNQDRLQETYQMVHLGIAKLEHGTFTGIWFMAAQDALETQWL